MMRMIIKSDNDNVKKDVIREQIIRMRKMMIMNYDKDTGISMI
jgi:hypothetical protein